MLYERASDQETPVVDSTLLFCFSFSSVVLSRGICKRACVHSLVWTYSKFPVLERWASYGTGSHVEPVSIPERYSPRKQVYQLSAAGLSKNLLPYLPVTSQPYVRRLSIPYNTDAFQRYLSHRPVSTPAPTPRRFESRWSAVPGIRCRPEVCTTKLPTNYMVKVPSLLSPLSPLSPLIGAPSLGATRWPWVWMGR